MEAKDQNQDSPKPLSVASSEYQGPLDENGLRTGLGNEKWQREYYQKFKGRFFQNSLHGRGHYSWCVGHKETRYNGCFYTSALDGYGKYSYNDLSAFEGLFKSNSRFGPGVFTYPNGSQDVGLWRGANIMRLCCVVKGEWVPRLAKSPTGKIKLIRYKKLVSVCDDAQDRAVSILKGLEANRDVMMQSHKLYNTNIRNPSSHFFNSSLHDHAFFCDKNCYIEVALSPDEEKAWSDKKSEDEQSTTDTSTPDFRLPFYDECVCDDPRQSRLEELKAELEHTEKILDRLLLKVKKARCLKKLAKKIIVVKEEVEEEEEEKFKSVAWERINENPAHNLYNIDSDQEQQEEEEDELECNLEENELVDYLTACKLLASARSAAKLITLKRKDLMDKIFYDTQMKEVLNKREANQHPTKRVLVTDLLAWNNEEISVEMLKHVFLHRNFEKEIGFHVSDLLVGDRSDFRSAGVYEEACISFLTECSNGNFQQAIDLYRKYDLNPDLCDVKGNTGIIFAAARDKIKMMQTLVNYGANVDVFNDECLTPLAMCLARYLAVQHNISDWEKAFLKPTLIENKEEVEIHEWRPHVSLASISNVIMQPNAEISIENLRTVSLSRQPTRVKLEVISDIFGSSLDVVQSTIIGSVNDFYHRLHKLVAVTHDYQEAYNLRSPEEKLQTYVFATDCIKPEPEKKQAIKKTKKKKRTKTSKSSKSKKSSKSSKKSSKRSKKPPKEPPKALTPEPDEKPTREELRCELKLNAIYNTIRALLKFGANPNACEVPLPTLLLSVFTQNVALVEDLLACNADPNVTTPEEHQTALHILVSLPPSLENVEILKVFLSYLANPNCKTDVKHWVEQKVELLGDHELDEPDEGKTPLHILAMRYDFALDIKDYLQQMVVALMQHGGKVKERYLGHTPLSLAIVRANLKLIRTLLETKRINPNQLLGENMGVPLTVLVLKRYKNLLPNLETCRNILQLLLEFKANPLNYVENTNTKNAIEFMNQEHELPPKDVKKKSKKENKKGKVKNKDNASLKKGKKDKKGKKGKKGVSVQEEFKKSLLEAAKTVLKKHIKGWAVKYLYFFVEEHDYYDEVSEKIAQFLTPNEAIEVAQLLVHRGEIPINDQTNYYTLYDFVEFITKINPKLGQNETDVVSEDNIDKMLENFEYIKAPKTPRKLNLPEPEVERHSEKYNVCFQCCRKDNHQLFVCPGCFLVYFCSEECNKLNNNDIHSPHKCGLLFYNTQKQIHEERLLRAAHWQETDQQHPGSVDLPKMYAGEDFGPPKKPVEPDANRKLHLTRASRKSTFKSILAKEPTALSPALSKQLPSKSTSDVRMLKKPEPQPTESILSLRWRVEGSGFLRWKGDSESNTLARGKMTRGNVTRGNVTHGTFGKLYTSFRNSSKDRITAKGSVKPDDSEEDIGGRLRSKQGHGEGQSKTLKSERKNKSTEDKTRFGAGDGKGDGGQNDGKRGEKGKEPLNSKQSKTQEKQSGKEKGDTKPVRVLGRESKEGAQRTQTNEVAHLGSKEKPVTPANLGMVGLRGGEGKDFGRITFNYTSIPAGGGRILELKRHLPSKYQYLLEKISEYWPDFDLSMLFLPYACYSNGQIYYRFLTSRPLFMETYSSV